MLGTVCDYMTQPGQEASCVGCGDASLESLKIWQ
jgi:hypothetical protein